jgi:hypothetical protein
MCFGNYRGRAVGWRSYRPLFPHLARAAVQQLALEFASREMAEIELAREIKPPMELAVGLIDVKNTWVEPPELVAERLRLTLKHIEPERVHVTPDCGFSQTARYLARSTGPAKFESSFTYYNNRTIVIVEALDDQGAFVTDAEFLGVIVDSAEKSHPLRFVQTAPGRYEAAVDAHRLGNAAGARGGGLLRGGELLVRRGEGARAVRAARGHR